jgi:ABC-type multidrug transport system ATPase subunit
MRELAQGGMTVIATIHQPSANAYFTFDRLLLLVKGAICYYGPVSEEHQQPMAYLKDAGFPCPPLNNPADFMFDVVVDDANAAKLVEKFLADGVAQDVERKPNPSLPKLSEDVTYESTFATQVLPHLAELTRLDLT